MIEIVCNYFKKLSPEDYSIRDKNRIQIVLKSVFYLQDYIKTSLTRILNAFCGNRVKVGVKLYFHTVSIIIHSLNVCKKTYFATA